MKDIFRFLTPFYPCQVRYHQRPPGCGQDPKNMAIIYETQGHYDQALEVYKPVLETKIRVCGQDSLNVAASKYNIASLKETQGDLEGARRLFLECEQIYAKVLGADHEETLDAAMRAQTVGEEKEDEEGEEGDSDEGEEEDQAGDSGER
jgi:tetratricopeptide (TPR) repeat protein